MKDEKTVNGVTLRVPEEMADKFLYSVIREKLDEVHFGKVNVEITVKDGKVVGVRTHKEETFNVPGAA